ncbi:MAG: hypothetical protein AABY22_16045 [Nanoarchaeota archaeon]
MSKIIPNPNEFYYIHVPIITRFNGGISLDGLRKAISLVESKNLEVIDEIKTEQSTTHLDICFVFRKSENQKCVVSLYT